LKRLHAILLVSASTDEPCGLHGFNWDRNAGRIPRRSQSAADHSAGIQSAPPAPAQAARRGIERRAQGLRRRVFGADIGPQDVEGQAEKLLVNRPAATRRRAPGRRARSSCGRLAPGAGGRRLYSGGMVSGALRTTRNSSAFLSQLKPCSPQGSVSEGRNEQDGMKSLQGLVSTWSSSEVRRPRTSCPC